MTLSIFPIGAFVILTSTRLYFNEEREFIRLPSTVRRTGLQARVLTKRA